MSKESCFNCNSFAYCGRIEYTVKNINNVDKIKEVVGIVAKDCSHYSATRVVKEKTKGTPLFPKY